MGGQRDQTMRQPSTSAPIRVMQVITRLNTGGATVHVVQLCGAIADAGCDCLLVTGKEGPNEGSMRELAVARGLRMADVPELGREIAPLSDLVTLTKLYRMMRRERPHIVHTHLAKAGFVGRIAARLARVPVVLHSSHGTIYQGYFSPAKTRLYLWLERLGGLLSTRIIASSPTLRDDLVRMKIISAGRIVIIPYGFELDGLATQPRHAGTFRDSLGIPRDASVAGTVGRLVAIKNIPLFLEAVALARQQGVDVRPVIVGGGELRAELEARARELGLADVAVFAGWQPDLLAVYADFDALVLSSNNEGTPVSLIEAMAAGCPVVSTRVGGVADLVTDGVTGRVVDAGDREALASAIVAVFREPEATQEMAARAKRYVLDRHQARERNRDVVRLYEELLQRVGIGRQGELAPTRGVEGA